MIVIQFAWDQTAAKLLNYQMVPIPTYVLTGNFVLLLLYLGLYNYQRSIPFGYLLQGY